MSTTHVRVGNPLTMSTTHACVGNPLTMSTTRAHARARRMPQSGLGLQLGGIVPPACLGDSLGRRRAPRDASNAPRARGMPYFLLQWEERNERCPLASGNCLCPSPRQGNARTRQGWPSLCTFASRRPRERPHAPGLARRGRRREHPAEGTPARARAGRSWRATRTPSRGNARTRARAGPSPASPRLSATPGGTRTRTLIHRTRTAHKGAIPPLCAAPCSLIPFPVCDTEKERGQDPRGTRRTGHSCCTA